MAGIQSLIESERADEWVRGAALDGLVTLVATGQKSRDEIITYFTRLYLEKLARRWSHVWDGLVSCTSELYPEELLGDIERAYKEGLVGPGFINLRDVQSDSTMGRDRVLARLADDPHRRLIDDTIASMKWWACFRPKSQPVERSAVLASPPRTVQAASKTGRNEPCPCGSGKKI